VTAERLDLTIAPTARRQLTEKLPEALLSPRTNSSSDRCWTTRAGWGSDSAPLEDRFSARRGTYRVIYRIDDEHGRVTVVGVAHRADAY
jgi:mRNA-degrading endonuclease RelE of RelBE toxin-antitoxin system